MENFREIQTDFAVSRMSSKNKEDYFTIKLKYDELSNQLYEWLNSRPENTDANQQKYTGYIGKLSELEKQMQSVINKYLK